VTLRALVILAGLLATLVLTPAASAQLLGGIPGVDFPIGDQAARSAPALPSPLLDPAETSDPTNLNPLSMLSRVGQSVDGAAGRSSTPDGGLFTGINILLVLTVVSLAPSIMLMCTSFVRILIVLGLLKQALGTATLPPPQVIVGLSLFMTMLVMAPTMDRINAEAVAPYRAGEIRTYDELWARARQPVRDFMFDQIQATGNWSSVYTVLNYRGIDTSDPSKLTTADVDMISLVPAYMLSELKTAFLIGFKVYLPFLVIDMVISSLLISMGMMMLPPVVISLPFKLLLFVLVDGWALVVGSLMESFRTRPAGGGGAAPLEPPVAVLHDAAITVAAWLPVLPPGAPSG
jgi:flagellar biosynthetic protein FliP